MKYKTAELDGRALDYAVALANGWKLGDLGNWWFSGRNTPAEQLQMLWATFTPSTSWEIGGPIIEREQIIYRQSLHGYRAAKMVGEFGRNRQRTALQNGKTLLIAAMRCYVASKLGETVELPEGLDR